jgi:SAM-dependent methyltransferase
MEAMLGPIDEPLIQALRLDAPTRIADVGCGGGGTAREILRRAPAGTIVHGWDISPGLIELARERAPEAVFEVADMAIAAPVAPYDRLVSRFGIMFFDDPQAAFANLGRWLEPRGRFAFAVWAAASENAWITTVREVVARIVEVPQPDPEGPGPFRYADSRKLLAQLDRAGFGNLDVRDWRGTIPIGGALPPAEAARFALSGFSSFGELLAKAGNDAFDEALRSLTTQFFQRQQDGVVRLDACVHIVTGARV